MTTSPVSSRGKVITVCGLVAPEKLGTVFTVLMHAYLHSVLYDWECDDIVAEEKTAASERRKCLLDDAVPLLRECREKHGLVGMGAVVVKDVPPNSVMAGNPARRLRDRNPA